MRLKDIFVHMIVIASFFGLLLVLIKSVEISILETYVEPRGMSIDAWLGRFTKIAIVASLISTAGILIWYYWCTYRFRVVKWNSGNSRLFWALVGFVTVLLSTVYGVLAVPPPQQGETLVYTLFAINAAFFYYLSTALCAPKAFKYAAWGSSRIRPGWL